MNILYLIKQGLLDSSVVRTFRSRWFCSLTMCFLFSCPIYSSAETESPKQVAIHYYLFCRKTFLEEKLLYQDFGSPLTLFDQCGQNPDEIEQADLELPVHEWQLYELGHIEPNKKEQIDRFVEHLYAPVEKQDLWLRMKQDLIWIYQMSGVTSITEREYIIGFLMTPTGYASVVQQKWHIKS